MRQNTTAERIETIFSYQYFKLNKNSLLQTVCDTSVTERVLHIKITFPFPSLKTHKLNYMQTYLMGL